jgi:hypothetical protein
MKLSSCEITTGTVPGGSAIVNPAVVASNGLARYSIDVLPDTIPDSAIEWSVAEGAGRLEFYNGNNKGRSVVVRGKEVGDFKLEVSINDGTFLPKPYIYGTVKERTVTPLHFFVACDAGGNPVLTNAATVINGWVDRANRDFAQAAMSFTVANITYVSSNEWVNVTNRRAFGDMCSYTNDVGGLEVYVVASLYEDANGMASSTAISGPRRGLAVKAGAPVSTLGHEIGHACGLDDILKDRLGNTLVSEQLVGPDNWSGGNGTGYYPSGLKHADLVQRLLMYQYGSADKADIPLGNVWAYGDDLGVQHPIIRAVGVNSMYTRNPRH